MSIFWENFPPSFEAGLVAGFDPFGPTGALGQGLSDPSTVVRHYLPLETFRVNPDAASANAAAHRTFLSSGTTGDVRSISRFSKHGLALYETGSLSAFFSIISRLFPDRRPTEVAGVSLIPDVKTWPDSSLAQMVAWITARAPAARYADENTFASQWRAASLAGTAPFWLFGTAFHFVNLMDQGLAERLPAGTVLIETGGTKGRSREVARGDFYRELSVAFGIPEDRIVSEYGMCELASQAYDWVEPGASSALDARRFRFPAWVQIAAVTGPGRTTTEGKGLLLVNDPLRIDTAEIGIRTEDLADVGCGGRFNLLGRAQRAPLRGCSLNAEDLLRTSTNLRFTGESTSTTEVITVDAQNLLERAIALNDAWSLFLRSPAAKAALRHDFKSLHQADLAIEDLLASTPKDPLTWVNAALTAIGGDHDLSQASPQVPRRWLIVAPGNHPLAALQPIFLAALVGLDVTVRMPKSLADEVGFLSHCVDILGAAINRPITSVDDRFRISSPGDAAAFDAILLYGSDETVAQISTTSGKPTVAFGNRFGISLIGADVAEPEFLALAKDAFSMGQTGCMATRLAILCVEDSVDANLTAKHVVERLVAASQLFATSEPKVQIGHELEKTRLGFLGFSMPTLPTSGDALIMSKIVDDDAPDFAAMLAVRQYTLPVAVIRRSRLTQVMSTLASRPSFANTLGTITASPRMRYMVESLFDLKSGDDRLGFRDLGSANAPFWNGTHEHRPVLIPR